MKRWIVGFVLGVMVIFTLNVQVASAAEAESESNNTTQTAQNVALGVKYDGVAEENDIDTGEDYYKIQLKEGFFYKISVTDMEDIGEYKWNSLQVDILPESDTDSSYTVSNDILEKTYSDKAKLFKATYTGNYYLRFECSEGAKYSFMIETFDPFGYHVKDSSSNEYMILGNRTLEFVKAASKNIESYDFIWSETFKTINGLEVINSYDAGFTVTSIGEYAFKGCNLKSVSFSESINYIGVGAFQDCKKLGTEKWIMGVVIRGKNVTIENDAFKGCKKLGSVRVLKGASIESVGKNSFKNTKKGIRLEVPNVKKYKRIFKKSGIKKAKFSKSYI